MPDLDAIRARDAENRLLRLGPEADPDLGDFIGAAVLDRRALLAEVDRLMAAVAPNIADIIRARDAERARITEAVQRARVYVDSGDPAIDAIADIATERLRKIILADIDR